MFQDKLSAAQRKIDEMKKSRTQYEETISLKAKLMVSVKVFGEQSAGRTIAERGAEISGHLTQNLTHGKHAEKVLYVR